MSDVLQRCAGCHKVALTEVTDGPRYSGIVVATLPRCDLPICSTCASAINAAWARAVRRVRNGKPPGGGKAG